MPEPERERGESQVENELLGALRHLGNQISREYNVKIMRTDSEKISLGQDFWVNINFFVKCDDPDILAKMNIRLAEKLSGMNAYLESKIEFIPSFISEV